MKPGTYTLTATQDGKTLEGAEIEIEAGKAYTCLLYTSGSGVRLR